MQNKNIFESRSQYLEIVKELYSELSRSRPGEKFPWFLIRIQTAYFLHLIYGGKIKTEEPATLNSGTSKISLKTKTKDFVKSIILSAKLRKNESILKNRLKNQTLYLGYKAHNIQGENYNIYLHPFLEDNKGEIFYLDAVSNDLQMQDYYNDLQKYYEIKCKNNNSNSLFISPVIDFLQNKLNINLNLLENNLRSVLQDFSVKKNISRRFIKTLNPKELFVYCYYDPNTNAMLHSANELKIKTTEYQHSSIADNHFAYSRWEDPDKFGLHFPKTFYVWADSDKELIINNFSGKGYIPKVKVVGNKYLQKTIEQANSENIDNNNILICLQGQWIPEFLEDFIYKDEEHKWYFRLHPRYPQDNILLQNFALKKNGNIIIERANDLELYDLFPEISVLITSFSGTALEAEKFGKKVIIFGEEGYNSYQNKIEDGIYKYIEKEEDVKSAVIPE